MILIRKNIYKFKTLLIFRIQKKVFIDQKFIYI